VVCFSKPAAVPVIVSVTVPTVATVATPSTNVAVSPGALGGLIAAVTPPGIPVTLSPTLPVKPPARRTLIVSTRLAPWVTASVGVVAASAKLPTGDAGIIVSVTFALLLATPLAVATIVKE